MLLKIRLRTLFLVYNLGENYLYANFNVFEAPPTAVLRDGDKGLTMLQGKNIVARVSYSMVKQVTQVHKSMRGRRESTNPDQDSDSSLSGSMVQDTVQSEIGRGDTSLGTQYAEAMRAPIKAAPPKDGKPGGQVQL
jgi:hypothetical protein